MIYDRQRGESGKAFAAFVLYRDAGADRSLQRVADEVGKTRRLMEMWSSRYQWVERSRQFDMEQDRKRQLKRAQEADRMLDRHASIAVLAQNVLVERLRSLQPDDLRPQVVAQLLKVAVEVERKSRGVPDRVEHVGDGGGPIRLSLNETLKRICSFYGLSEELADPETNAPAIEGDAPPSAEP